MSANPYKVGDKVHHNGVIATVLKVDGDRVFSQRLFNGLCYWDNHDYWEPHTEDVKPISRIECVFNDQGDE